MGLSALAAETFGLQFVMPKSIEQQPAIVEMASTATPTAMLVGTAIIAAISGYMIGIASSLGFLPIPFAPRISQSADNTPARRDANYHDEAESSEEEVEDSNLDHAPNWAQGLEADRRDGLSAKKIQRADEREKQEWELVDSNEECKMVLVVRADLGMTKGTFPLLLLNYLLNDLNQAK